MTHHSMGSNAPKSNTPVVFVRDGVVFANSRDVAAFFEKRHDNVMRDVRNVLSETGSWGLLNFEETPYVDEQNGQTYKAFSMTKNGFTYLVQGYTGPKAASFKIAYIDRFDAMEATLKETSPEVDFDFAPEMQPATAPGLMPTTREVNAFTRLLGEVRRIAGRDSAVVVYVQTPLHQAFALPSDLAGTAMVPLRAEGRRNRRLDGAACLRRLLSARVARRGVTVSDLLHLAKGDRITRNSLADVGLRRDPENWRGWLAVAASHPKLQAVFSGSVWAEGWDIALQTLPGARLAEIDGFVSRRSVLIPMDVVERSAGGRS